LRTFFETPRSYFFFLPHALNYTTMNIFIQHYICKRQFADSFKIKTYYVGTFEVLVQYICCCVFFDILPWHGALHYYQLFIIWNRSTILEKYNINSCNRNINKITSTTCLSIPNVTPNTHFLEAPKRIMISRQVNNIIIS